jgi:hypothetical protein
MEEIVMTVSVTPTTKKAGTTAYIIEKRHIETVSDFKKAISNDDELGVVIRTHIVIEKLMADIVKLHMGEVHYDSIKFMAALTLIRAAGRVDSNTYVGTKQLNSFRNKFAHQRFGITNDVLKDLKACVSAFPQKYALEHIDDTKPVELLKSLLFGLFMHWLDISYGVPQNANPL